MLQDPYYWYGITLCTISIIFALNAMYSVYQFKSYSNFRFLKLRKPSLILLYCCSSICMLLTLCPVNIYLTVQRAVSDIFWIWFLHFWQEFLISCMLILITARCWLLYYDHTHGVSLVDKNWRGIISEENNFWLKYRRTWGDFGFVMCVAIVISVIVLIALCSISIYVLQKDNIAALHLVSLSLVAVPCCVLIFIFSTKLKGLSVYDEFMILREMQCLSLSVLLVIVVYIIELIDIHPSRLNTVVQTGHVMFCALTNYIQTQWVIKQLVKQNTMLVQEKAVLNAVLKAPRDPNAPHLSMSDILKDKDGFLMFMRHCQYELNVEGLLFIVEVAQYKAKLHDIINIQNMSLNIPLSVSTLDRRDSYASRGGNTNTETTSLPALNRINIRKETSISPPQTDGDLQQLEAHILERDWIPISAQLFRPKHAHRHRKSQDIEAISNELKIMYNEEEVKSEEEKNEIMQLQQQDAKMYEYAQHLFLKYIDVESDFTINVSYTARKAMLLFFSKHRRNGFQYILKKNGIHNLVVNDKYDQIMHSLMIKQYLYNVFDQALTEIWKLLSCDTYLRFMRTKQYQYLVKNYKMKNEN